MDIKAKPSDVKGKAGDQPLDTFCLNRKGASPLAPEFLHSKMPLHIPLLSQQHHSPSSYKNTPFNISIDNWIPTYLGEKYFHFFHDGNTEEAERVPNTVKEQK